jgi:hypothetical protein
VAAEDVATKTKSLAAIVGVKCAKFGSVRSIAASHAWIRRLHDFALFFFLLGGCFLIRDLRHESKGAVKIRIENRFGIVIRLWHQYTREAILCHRQLVLRDPRLYN